MQQQQQQQQQGALFYFTSRVLPPPSVLLPLEAALDEALERVAAMAETNAQLMGHSNAKQKIQQHMKLKEEINDLQRTNADLHMKVSSPLSLSLSLAYTHTPPHDSH